MKRKLDPTALIKKASKSLISKAAQYPDFQIGDTIRVHVKVTEGEKTRVQIFEGIVIAIKRGGPSSSFIVRKISYGVGVERIFPFLSPVVDKITMVSKGEVRRAKLYYLRALSGRSARIKSEQVFGTGAEGSSNDAESTGPTAQAAQA